MVGFDRTTTTAPSISSTSPTSTVTGGGVQRWKLFNGATWTLEVDQHRHRRAGARFCQHRLRIEQYRHGAGHPAEALTTNRVLQLTGQRQRDLRGHVQVLYRRPQHDLPRHCSGAIP